MEWKHSSSGCTNYICTKQAFQEGGYEPPASEVGPQPEVPAHGGLDPIAPCAASAGPTGPESFRGWNCATKPTPPMCLCRKSRKLEAGERFAREICCSFLFAGPRKHATIRLSMENTEMLPLMSQGNRGVLSAAGRMGLGFCLSTPLLSAADPAGSLQGRERTTDSASFSGGQESKFLCLS